jgi:hypothetical protein
MPKPKTKSKSKRKTQRKQGAQPGNKNALKHGFYADKFTAAESTKLDSQGETDLKAEIAALRVCIDRLLNELDFRPQDDYRRERQQLARHALPPPTEHAHGYDAISRHARANGIPHQRQERRHTEITTGSPRNGKARSRYMSTLTETIAAILRSFDELLFSRRQYQDVEVPTRTSTGNH